MWQLARQPRWIGVLFVCLAVAAAFAALGQWQLSRAVEGGETIDRATEAAVPLSSIAEPQTPVTTEQAGQRVTFPATAVEGDYVVIGERFNKGVAGYWVVAHVLVGTDVDATTPSLAVALGWAPDRESATSIIQKLEGVDTELTGRYLATEPPNEDDFENGEQKSVAVGALINQWQDNPDTVYGGYVVADDAPAGLETIDSPKPTSEITLNWLNIFYSIEWAVFAVFAVFLWFRLVKDEWERQQEDEAGELN